MDTVNIERVRKECANSFWKFVSRLHRMLTLPLTVPLLRRTSTKPTLPSRGCLTPPPWLPPPHLPCTSFNNDHIQLHSAIIKSSYSSSPCPIDQIPYSIVKKCPALVPALLEICGGVHPMSHLCGKRPQYLIPKKTAQVYPSNPVNFRQIALTSCVGKLFSTIMKNRLLSYMLANGFLDRNIQNTHLVLYFLA